MEKLIFGVSAKSAFNVTPKLPHRVVLDVCILSYNWSTTWKEELKSKQILIRSDQDLVFVAIS